jgi:hypothetical protein
VDAPRRRATRGPRAHSWLESADWRTDTIISRDGDRVRLVLLNAMRPRGSRIETRAEDMPEKNFRYVRAEQVAAWQRAGWRAIGKLARAPDGTRDVIIMEWIGTSEPIEPGEPDA